MNTKTNSKNPANNLSEQPSRDDYIIVMTRSIPADFGTDTLVKKVTDTTTMKEVREWIEFYGKGAACVVRVEIVKAE